MDGLERGGMLMTLTKPVHKIHKNTKFMNHEPVFYETVKYLQMHKYKREKLLTEVNSDPRE